MGYRIWGKRSSLKSSSHRRESWWREKATRMEVPERGNGSDMGYNAETTASNEAAQADPMSANAMASRSIMFMLLSSDDGDDSSDADDEDAATTMGSPLAQPDPVTPPAKESPAKEPAACSGWMRAKQATTAFLHEASRVPPTRIQDVFATRPRRLEEEVADEEDDDVDDFPPASQQSDVVLSPASQLHILSQISEMASMRAAKEREAAAAAASKAARAGRPAHAWAPVAKRAQTQEESNQRQSPTGASKKRKTTVNPPASRKSHKPTKTIAPGLMADIATWDVFDEPILAGDDAAEDEWSFEEISDSDF